MVTMSDLSEAIAQASQKYESLQVVKAQSEAQQEQAAIAAVKQKFRELMLQHVSEEFLSQLPGFQWGYFRTNCNLVAGCATFTLQDEFDNNWNLQFESYRPGNEIRLRAPSLKKRSISKESALIQRNASYGTWASIDRVEGLTWEETILLAIGSWKEQVEDLRLNLVIEEIRAYRRGLDNRYRNYGSAQEQMVRTVDRAIWNEIKAPKHESIAIAQDAEISETLQQWAKQSEVCLHFPITLYQWEWCKGSGDNEEKLEYESAYALSDELTKDGYLPLASRDPIKLILNVAKPTCTKKVFESAEQLAFEFKFLRRGVEVEGIRKLWLHDGTEAYVWSDCSSIVYYSIPQKLPPAWLIRALDLLEPRSTVVLSPPESYTKIEPYLLVRI